MTRKFYKTVYTIEVLSEGPMGDCSLADVQYEITEGHSSGVFREKSSTEITEYQMAKELMRQGSDVEFLLPDWVQCPYCEGTGQDILDDATHGAVVLECWRCGGVGMLSPKSAEIYEICERTDNETDTDA